MDFFSPEFFSLVRWEWWVLIAISMLVLEIFLPGAVFIWPGLAAIVMAFIVAFTDFTWQTYSVIFSVLTMLFGFLARPMVLRLRAVTEEGEEMNEEHSHIKGDVCQVIEPVNQIQGRVKHRDSSYEARTKGNITIPVDKMVKVVSIEGLTLFVELVQDEIEPSEERT